MAITYISSAELIVGEGNPSFDDTKNRAGKYIDAQMLVEHLSTGVHKERSTLLTGEQYTFTGNGAARTITLQNTKITPSLVECWEIPDTTTELVTNGEFSTDTAGWLTVYCSIASVAGGQAGNCLELTRTSDSFQVAYSTAFTAYRGYSYAISGYVKSGTSGDEAYQVRITDILTGDIIASGTTSSSWVQWSATWTPTQDYISNAIIALIKPTATAGTMLFDTITCKNSESSVSQKLITFPSDYSNTRKNTLLVTNGLGSLATGSFSIPANSTVNHNGVTNYYYVLGVDVTTVPSGDAGAGSDPTWITSDVANLMYGDGTGVSTTNWANSVEGEIETAFLHEHNDNGTHTAPIWSGYGQVETYTYVGDGTDNRVVSLQDTTLIIKELFLFRDYSGAVVASKNVSMAYDATKLETTASLASNYIESIGTGSFVVGSTANIAGVTYYYYAAGE